jgi:hypothetical protein
MAMNMVSSFGFNKTPIFNFKQVGPFRPSPKTFNQITLPSMVCFYTLKLQDALLEILEW